jgi:hypothetical protein
VGRYFRYPDGYVVDLAAPPPRCEEQPEPESTERPAREGGTP